MRNFKGTQLKNTQNFLDKITEIGQAFRRNYMHNYCDSILYKEIIFSQQTHVTF